MRGLILTTALIGTLWCAAPERAAADAAPPAANGSQGQTKVSNASSDSIYADAAWASWDLRGESAKLRQYATPPTGFYLRELRYVLRDLPGISGGLLARGLGADDVFAAGNLSIGYGTTQIEGQTSRNRFYDLTPTVINDSDRKDAGFSLRQAISRSFGLSVAYHMDRQDQYFESPADPLRQATRYWEAVAQGTAGPGLIGLSFTDWRYFDRTTERLSSAVSRMQMRYLWEPGPMVGLEGLYAHTLIRQPGLADSHVDTLAFNGEMSVASATDLSVCARGDRFDLPNAQGVYIRESRQASASLAQRWRSWTAQVGVRENEIERVNLDHTYVDVPKWWTFDGRISGRVSRQYRLSMRASLQDLAGAPQSLLTDTTTLYWNDRTTAQISLEGGPPQTSSYLVASYRRWANSARNVGITSRSVTAGATWDVIPRMSIFAEYTREGWWANSEISAFPLLENFAPNNSVFVTGCTWYADKGTYVWANYTHYGVDNDNPLLLINGNTTSEYLTVTIEHRFPAGYGVTLMFAPWYYRDVVTPSMNYDAQLVMLSGSAKF